MKQNHKSIGLDVHEARNAVASADFFLPRSH